MKDVSSTKPPEQKGAWRVRDVLLGFILLIVLDALSYVGLSALKLADSYHALRGAALLRMLLVTLFLITKYPLSMDLDSGLPRILRYALGGAAGLVVVYFSFGIWRGPIESVPVQYEVFISSGTLGRMFLLSGLFLLGPVVEECLFRGMFFRILRNRYDFLWGALVSSFMFALLHGLDPQTLLLFSMQGFVFAYVYEKSGSIVSSIITHALVNICWLALTYVDIQRLS